jgi:uncharacterized protein
MKNFYKQMTNIEKTHAFLYDVFNQSVYLNQNPKEKTYRLEHTIRVANIGSMIAKAEGFNQEATIIGCLLHDLAYAEEFKSKDDWMNHGRRSAQLAREFLDELSIDEKLKAEILYGIAIHVDDQAGYDGPNTQLAQTIGEADNIDRFDMIRLTQTIAGMELHTLSVEEQMTLVMDKLSHLLGLKNIVHSTKTSNDLWQERLNVQIHYFERLKNQLQRSNDITL